MARFFLILFLAALTARSAWSQPRPLAKPDELGLRLPVGKTPYEVNGRRVLVPRSDGDGDTPTVAQVYLEVGSHYVVILPDGTLRSIEKRLTTDTDRPFEPMSKDELTSLLKKQFPGFKTRATRRYICVYNTSDGFCERKSKILETMYPKLVSYFDRHKLEPTDPLVPLIVVMFRTKKEFQAYRNTPDQMLAYYNTVNNRVFLYQNSETSADAPLIAAKQSTSTIAHEGVHQILHNIGVQKRLSAWPLWISEGLAEYFSPTSSGIRSKWSGVGKPNELRMRELFIHLKDRRNVGSGALVEELVIARKFNSTDYAAAWSLVHYLTTKRKDEFFEYLRDVSTGLPLEPAADELARFTKHFGDDFRKLEREMLVHIRGLPYSDPIANQPYFLVTAISGKKKQATVTSSINIKRVKGEMLAKISPKDRLRTIFHINRFPNRRSAMQAMQLYLRK